MATRKKLTRAILIKFLKDHKAYFRDQYGFKNIYVFGSYAKNKQHARSDVDILVDAVKEKKTYDNYFDAQEFLQKQLRAKVDKKQLNKLLKSEFYAEINYLRNL
jgi:uncharacterized protein